jgi:serine/threonine-protein kinase
MPPPWQHADRVAELFGSLLEAGPEGRVGILARLSEEPAEVAHEVRSLLDASDQCGPFLSLLDPKLGSLLLESAAGSGAPEHAGAFRLLHEIGRGGMGAVYLAERADGAFTQRVAVKVLKRGMDSDAIVARFLRERGILARLEHPGIARLLDGGAANDGRPYFAMEYVEGETLLRWCDERRLPIRRRLDLFERVCRIVQYAHAHLVVHRDLKPANILVTADGEPKLLDFGIAKLISAAPGEDESLATLGDGHIMTPDYAAPEQVRGEAVTVATDVYALGLLLFELLAGRRASSLSKLTPAELERTICATPAVPPSAAISNEAGSRLAESRGLRPARLRRQLRGDLDTIVLRALAKEPGQRYASAEALADDVHAFLDGQPIRARPESRIYRARRFVGRNRVAVAATAAVGLALVVGTGLALWQGRVAALERDRAQAEARRAQQVQVFVAGLFEASDPQESRGDEITARELLERGVVRIGEELAGQPESQAELSSVIGGVYLGLGQFERAETLFRSGAELSRTGQAADPARLSRLLHQLGEALTAQGRYEESLVPLQESLRLRRMADPASPESAASFDALGVSHHYAGDLGQAETLYRQAFSIFTERLGPAHPSTLATENNLANLMSDRGQFDEAVSLHRRILEHSLPIYGEVHPEIAVSLGNLATALRKRGLLSEARSTHLRALAIKTQLYGERHPSLSTTRNNLGVTLRSLGQYRQAETLFARVLEDDRASLPADHAFLAYSLDNLASVQAEQLRTSEALELLDAARTIHLRASGAESPVYAAHLSITARVLEIEGRFAEAATVLDESLAIQRREWGPDHPRTARSQAARARISIALEGPAEAEIALVRALGIQERVLPSSHPDTAETLLSLAKVYLEQGRRNEARVALDRALATRTRLFSSGQWPAAEVEALLGVHACVPGRAIGRERLQLALARLSEGLDPAHPVVRDVARLGRFCTDPAS